MTNALETVYSCLGLFIPGKHRRQRWQFRYLLPLHLRHPCRALFPMSLTVLYQLSCITLRSSAAAVVRHIPRTHLHGVRSYGEHRKNRISAISAYPDTEGSPDIVLSAP